MQNMNKIVLTICVSGNLGKSDFALIIYRPQINWMVKSGDDILRVCQIL